mmetsp:Transcript_7910/g.14641  ORF Transcript_7910/g.14641 Transcript_7910/m.14641 type:complete len:395 (-) Transcript_7910:375-1559(-)
MDSKGFLALIVLTLQNVSVPLLMRMARTRQAGADVSLAYCVPLLVCFQELCKIAFSLVLLVREQGGVAAAARTIRSEIVLKPYMTLRLGVPAGCYFIQNNCQQLANSYLPAAVYAVTYQGKTLVVALMSVVLLNKQLQMFRWAAIVGLAVGVAMVQCAKAPDSVSKEADGSALLVGLAYAITAASMSGFAGVYFEKMIKAKKSGGDRGSGGGGSSGDGGGEKRASQRARAPSLWIRNIQLALFSLFVGVPTVFTSSTFDPTQPLRGFDAVVWGLGVNNAVGGLIVALVVKYADNILKCFSNALSTVIGTLICIPLFGFEPSAMFALGGVCVLSSALLYGEAFKCPFPMCDDILFAGDAGGGSGGGSSKLAMQKQKKQLQIDIEMAKREESKVNA